MKKIFAASLSVILALSSVSATFGAKYNSSTTSASVNLGTIKKENKPVIKTDTKKDLTKKNYETVVISGITYLVTSANTLAVGDNTKSPSASFNIPDTINVKGTFYDVTQIGDNAFGSKVKSVTIGTNVKEISPKAFNSATNLINITVKENNSAFKAENNILYNYKKTTLVKYPNGLTKTDYTIPDNVTDINDYAFYKNSVLKTITTGAKTKNIGNYAFYKASALTTFNSTITVEKIGNYAFARSGLSQFANNSGLLKEIGTGAFMETKIKSFTVPGNVTEIKGYAFYNCSNLTKFTFNEKIKSIGNFAFANTLIASIELPADLLTIGNNAFENCEKLYICSSKNKITTIGDNAFINCKALNKFSVPSTVTKIGKDAFLNCSRLAEIYVGSQNKNYTSEHGALYNKDKSLLIHYPGANTDKTYYVSPALMKIEDNAFKDAQYLQSFAIDDTSQYFNVIDDVLFDYNGNKLYSFPQSKNTENYQVPYGVTEICNYAFVNSNITNILNIPATVSKIGNHSFQNCIGITGFSVDNRNQYYTDDKGVLYTKDMSKLVAFPKNSRLTSFTVPDSVKEIYPSAFYGTKLDTVTLNKNLTKVGEYAFANSKISKLTFTENVTEIGAYALANCDSLISIKYTNSTTKTTVGKNITKGSKNLKSSTVPTGKASLYTFK